ncbi:phage tail tape measure protein [Turicimonas muris]|uniref:phage tail tape measure protein n=1 Tax=Turicimonas muris TaxID=1796652 RepID=UPI0024947948|nr:phage tail tape measure protein [Turicimonas muris]
MATKYEIHYQIYGQLSSDFTKSFSTASKAIKDANKNIEGLRATAGQTDQLVKLKNETKKVSEQFFRHKETVKQLEKALKQSKTPQEFIVQSLKEEKSALDKTGQELRSRIATIQKLTKATNNYGLSLAAITKKSVLLNKALSFKNKGLKLNEKIKGTNTEAVSSAGMVSMLGAQMIHAGSAPVKQAMAVEDAMADIKKVVDFKEPDGLQKMKESLQEMSLVLPMNTVELMKITAAAGQAGIAEKDLLKFTEAAAKMGVAFDMSAEEAGEMMAKWRSGMNLTQDEAISLADATNALSNNNAALGKQIGETLKRYGALGKVAGLTEKQTAALAATVIGSGAEAEVAATGINAFMRALVKGGSMSKGQKAAFQDLGLDPSALQQEVKTDAPKAILKVLERIKKVRPEEQMRTLTDMFGEEGARAMGPMLANTELLAKNFELVANKANYAGSMEAEFQARAATTSNAFVLMGNAIDYISGSIGEALLPSLKENILAFVEIGKAVGSWIKNNPKLVSTITSVVMVIGGLTLGFHALRAVSLYAYSGVLSVTKAFLLAKGAIFQAAAAAPQFINGIKGVGLAIKGFFLSPVGAAILIGAALIGVGILIYRNWDTIKEKLGELWSKFEETFPGIAETLTNFYNATIQPTIEGIKTAFDGLIAFITGVFSGNWSQAWTGITETFSGIFGGISNLAKAPINGVISLVNSAIRNLNSISVEIPSMMPGIGGQKFGVNIPEIPLLASGGIATGPTLSMIGEGSEPEAVLPLSRLSSMMSPSASTGPVTVNLSINVEGGSSAADGIRTAGAEAAETLKRQLERILANERRLAY